MVIRTLCNSDDKETLTVRVLGGDVALRGGEVWKVSKCELYSVRKRLGEGPYVDIAGRSVRLVQVKEASVYDPY